MDALVVLRRLARSTLVLRGPNRGEVKEPSAAYSRYPARLIDELRRQGLVRSVPAPRCERPSVVVTEIGLRRIVAEIRKKAKT